MWIKKKQNLFVSLFGLDRLIICRYGEDGFSQWSIIITIVEMQRVFNIPIHLSVLTLILFGRWLNLRGESFNFLSNVIGLEDFDHTEICPTPVKAILWWFQADLLCTSKAWKDNPSVRAFGSTFEAAGILMSHIVKRAQGFSGLENVVTTCTQDFILLFSKARILIGMWLTYCVQSK